MEQEKESENRPTGVADDDLRWRHFRFPVADQRSAAIKDNIN